MERQRQFRNIVVVVTENCEPQPALEWALKIARANGGTVTLLDIVEPVPAETHVLFSAQTLERLQAAAIQRRAAALAPVVAIGENAGVVFATKTAVGSEFRAAIRAVLIDGYDLVVKTFDRKHTGSRAARSSTDNHLLRKCPCALCLVDGAQSFEYRCVLAAVNPDPDDPEEYALSMEILRVATNAAAMAGAELHLLHAWKVLGELLLGPPAPLVSDPEVDHIMGLALSRHAKFVADLIDRTAPAGVVPKTHIVHARAANAIIDFVRSQGVDLLVIGTIGRTGIPGLLIGNTAERVLSEVECSVLALKPRGFVSPVTLDG